MANSSNLKMTAYQTLKQKILDNDLKPGDYLEEKRLCEMLGISRTPIREAIGLLERDDLVQMIPNKGVFVTTISLQSIKELFQVRHFIEPMVMRMAMPLLDADELLEFKTRFQRRIDEKDYPELHRMDYEFHNYIHKHCGNSYLIRIAENISNHFQRVRTREFFTEERTENGAKEHIQLIDLMVRGDVKRACALLETHISNTESYFLRSII